MDLGKRIMLHETYVTISVSRHVAGWERGGGRSRWDLAT
jgi:hypothetical protein